jgi:purine-binding chemotaxis protein CheW
MQVIIFELQGKQYAIKTDQIEEISRLLDITFVPNAPHYIKGLVNLRGNVITLMDISKLLNLELQDEDYTNIIIAKVHKELVGILVGNVWEVMNIKKDMVERIDIGEEENQGLKGVIQIQDQIINFLDIEEFIA